MRDARARKFRHMYTRHQHKTYTLEDLKGKVDKMLTELDRVLFNNIIHHKTIENAFGTELSHQLCNNQHFWGAFIDAFVRLVGQAEAKYRILVPQFEPYSDKLENVASWTFYELSLQQNLDMSGFQLNLPSPEQLYEYFATFFYSNDEQTQTNTLLAIMIMFNLYCTDTLIHLWRSFIIHHEKDRGDISLSIYVAHIIFMTKNNRAHVYALQFIHLCLEQRLIDLNEFLEEQNSYFRFKFHQLSEQVPHLDPFRPCLEEIPSSHSCRDLQVAILAKAVCSLSYNSETHHQRQFLCVSHGMRNLSYGHWCCGTHRPWTAYQLADSVRELSQATPGRVFYFEARLLTQGSIRFGFVPRLDSESFESDLECRGSVMFETLEQSYWIDARERDPASWHVRELRDGATVGCLLNTSESDLAKVARFYIDGELIPIQPALKLPAKYASKSTPNWSDDLYLTVCLASFQQVLLVLNRDGWLHLPQNVPNNAEVFELLKPVREWRR